MPQGVEESDLALAAANGDGQAFARLYDTYEQRIFNFCLRILGGKQDAEDATQDAFIKVLGRLPELEKEDLNFGAYLFTAARNASYDVVSRRKKSSPVDELPADAAPMFRETAELGTDPVRANMLEDQRISVQAANALLPERQREVLALREVEEMSYDEIAEVMDSNPNSVAQLISRARLNLRNHMLVGAGASISADTPECERAMPLLAMKQDGKLKDAGDAVWMETHLGNCQSCQLAEEAMSEAGVSYRAWLPVAPAAYLFRDTLAKASESIGADWSGVERPSGPAAADSPARTETKDSFWHRRNLMAGAAVGLALLVALVTAISVDESDAPSGFGIVDTSAQSGNGTPKVLKNKNEPKKSKGDQKGRSQGSEAVITIDEPEAVVPVPQSSGSPGGSDGSRGSGGNKPDTGRPSGGGKPDPGGPSRPPTTPPKPDPVVPPVVVPPVTPQPDPPPIPPTPNPPVPGGPIPG